MNRRVVLNVDPDSETRPVVSQILRDLEMDVQETSTAAEALQLARTLQPALAVVSGRIEREDLRGFCREMAGVCSALILLRIASPQYETFTGDLNGSGADYYVREPLQPAVLSAAARCLLRLWHAEQGAAALKRQLASVLDDFYLCVARVSHDVAQAGRGFSTLCEIIAPEVPQWPPEKTRYLQLVKESAGRTRGLLKDLASYAQVSRETEASHRSMGLQAVVLAAEAGERASMEEAGAEIHSEALPVVKGNPARLQQLMGCLLSNSLKFRSPERSLRIRIAASRDTGGDWLISVADNGIGIEPQYHESIFTPFQRIHGLDLPGSGMGLALCRQIVKAHGGEIRVESSAGQGATFLFTLPAGQP